MSTRRTRRETKSSFESMYRRAARSNCSTRRGAGSASTTSRTSRNPRRRSRRVCGGSSTTPAFRASSNAGSTGLRSSILTAEANRSTSSSRCSAKGTSSSRRKTRSPRSSFRRRSKTERSKSARSTGSRKRGWTRSSSTAALSRPQCGQPRVRWSASSHSLTVAEPQTAMAENVAAKFERRIAQQRESMEALREEAMRLEAQAVFLYGHYAVFDELLKAIREGRTPPEHAQVKAIDRKEHTVTLAIGDFDAITLEYEKEVTANAQALYERRKDALAKSQRVDEATAATRAEMEAAQAKAVKVAKRPRIKSTKSMWFEAYRWTISSEGFLILGGRDARTNDQLVKKHLKEGDRYAHADVHGAPSTVVKDGARASDVTLREACEFALAYSKAWSAGLASGSAYWVLPEQVSKQAESGEFLPRGAFVIRGKRNYIHDLPVRMAIGEVEVEGHRKIMGGPVTAVATRSARYVVLAPGKGDREAITKKLASIFGVPIEEIARAMPPGSVEIVERHGIEA